MSIADSQSDIVINNSSFNSPNGISSDSSFVWVPNGSGGTNGNGSVSKINIATGAVTEIDSSTFHTPHAIVSDGSNVWAANQTGGDSANGSVSKINIATGVVTEIDSSTFHTPCGISYDGTNIWVANQTGGVGGLGSVSKINVATSAITEIDSTTFDEPEAIVANGSSVWVPNGYGGTSGNGSVSKINIATSAVTQINSSTFNDITNIAVDNSNIWVTNYTGGSDALGSVSEINITTNVVTAITSTTFTSPYAIASDGINAWVGNSGGGQNGIGSLSEINIASGAVTMSEHPSISTPIGLTINGSNIWIANQDGGATGVGSVTKINFSQPVAGSNNPPTSTPKPTISPTPKPTPKPKPTIKTLPGQPPGTRIPLKYSIPPKVAALTFRLGQKLPAGLSYCLPIPNVNFGTCGGTDVKKQQQPYGGVKISGPYHFTVTDNYLPIGLVLHSNGALTGTVSDQNDARSFPFSICVSEVGIAPSPGNTDTVCQKTKIVLKPMPSAFPYDGIWNGGSFVGNLTTTTTPGQNADYGTTPVTSTSAVSIGGIWLGIQNGSIGQFTGYGTDGSFDIENIVDKKIDPKISATGLVTGLALSGDVHGVNFTNCIFSMQFQNVGEVTSVGQLSCQGADGYGTPATLTGSFTLSRT